MKGGDEEKVVNLAFFFLLSFLPLRPVNPPSIIVVDVLNGMAESGAKNERLIESYSLSLCCYLESRYHLPTAKLVVIHSLAGQSTGSDSNCVPYTLRSASMIAIGRATSSGSVP